MPVLTSDILLEDIQRDDIFEWLGNLDNHLLFLTPSVQKIEKISMNELSISLTTNIKNRSFLYTVHKKDDEHGGRRIKIITTGKRSTGILSYSLRTMKPSRNTMLTITWDYEVGSALGLLLNTVSLSKSYQRFLNDITAQIDKNTHWIPKTNL